jgi:type I restriction enzyme S subunit
MKQGWEIKKLSQIFEVKSSRRVHQSDWKSSGIPFYRAREVVKLAREGNVANELFISQELYDEFTKGKGAPKTGDIIVSAVGTLGQCYLVRDSDKFYFKDASVLWFENLGKVNSRFIEYAFKADSIMAQVMEGSMGATVGTLTISRAKGIEIPVPSLHEQQRIVAILDTAFAAIAKAKANAEQNLKNAKELFESHLQGVFEAKGEGWEEKTLGEVLLKTESVDPTKKPDDEFIYLDVSSVNKETKEIENTTVLLGKDAPSRARKLVRTNDVIFATVRPTHSRVALITEEYDEQVCSTGYFVLRAKDFLSNNLVYYFLLTYSFNKQMEKLQKGASYPAVNDSDVKGIIISFPKSLKKQKAIVQKLDALSLETKKLEAIYQQKIKDLEELKKSVLQKAFAGELKTKEELVS